MMLSYTHYGNVGDNIAIKKDCQLSLIYFASSIFYYANIIVLVGIFPLNICWYVHSI